VQVTREQLLVVMELGQQDMQQALGPHIRRRMAQQPGAVYEVDIETVFYWKQMLQVMPATGEWVAARSHGPGPCWSACGDCEAGPAAVYGARQPTSTGLQLQRYMLVLTWCLQRVCAVHNLQPLCCAAQSKVMSQEAQLGAPLCNACSPHPLRPCISTAACRHARQCVSCLSACCACAQRAWRDGG
jgi:hypothetical protein